MDYSRDYGSGFEYETVKTSSCEEYHCHNRIEIIYVKEGNIRLRTDMSHSVCDLFAGDYAVIASSDVHRCFCMGKSEYELIRFPVAYQNMLDGKPVRHSFVVPCEVLCEQSVVADTLLHIKNFLSQKRIDKSTERNLCSSLCSILMSFYDRRKAPDFPKTSSGDTDNNSVKTNIAFETIEKFDLALDYIRENYASNKINLETLSAVSGLNKTFLSALFPKLTGRNFKDYLSHLRVDRAIELITTSEKNISEIAFLCGFDTIRTLNNVFKSIAGVTPSAIRAGASGNKNSGIDTEIHALDSRIFEYSWTCTVLFEKDLDNNAVHVFPRVENSKNWCHLGMRMLFFAGKEYRVSFKIKLLCDVGNMSVVNCNFCFPDDVLNIEHHSPNRIDTVELGDGWKEHSYSYTVPDYYKPSSSDNFSVYTSPYKDKGVGYEVKDIEVKLI